MRLLFIVAAVVTTAAAIGAQSIVARDVDAILGAAQGSAFFERAAGPRVWRRLHSTTRVEVLELHELTPAGWVRETHGVGDPREVTWIEAIVRRPDRYIVAWSLNSWTVVSELFDDSLHGSTMSGVCDRVWSWSRGAMVCSEGSGSDGFAWFEDFGPWGRTELPQTWGWGTYAFRVCEPTPGYPFVAATGVPEIVLFRIGSVGPLPAPGGVPGLCWFQDGRVVLADIGGRIMTWGPTGWSLVAALAGRRGLAPLGELGARSFLCVGDALFCLDAAIGTMTMLAQAFVMSPRGFLPIGEGFLFVADDRVHGRELWFSGGTSSTTRLVVDLRPGGLGSSPRRLEAVEGGAVFLADDGTGTHLFVIDELELEWMRSPIDGHWYRLTEPLGWMAVERHARRLGGQLVTVRSSGQQAWLARTFGDIDPWIRLNDLDRDGVYEWSSGEPVAFTAWCPGEPNPVSNDDVAVRIARDCAGGWRVDDLTRALRGIVERETRPSPIEVFGDGCEGEPRGLCRSYGPATLRWQGGRPALGADVRFVLDARQLPSGRPVPHRGLVLLGFDNTMWGGSALPLTLDVFGWPRECALRVAIVR